MNINQIRYLIEISKSPSLSVASQNLHISTPALSIAIKKLEEELGFSLLNRSFKGISLTEAGQEFIKLSSAYLNNVTLLQQKYQPQFFSSRHFGSIRIPVNYFGFGDNILGEFVVQLSLDYPDFHVSVDEASKSSIIQQVLNNEIEFGFIFRTKLNGQFVDSLDPDLLFAPLVEGSLKLLTGPASELSQFQSVTLKRATQYPMCSFEQSTSNPDYQRTGSYYIQDLLRMPIQLEIIHNFAVYREKVRLGLSNGLSIQLNTDDTPTNYIEGCKILNVRDDIQIFFGIVHRSDSIFSDDAVFFMRELEKYVSLSSQMIR